MKKSSKSSLKKGLLIYLPSIKTELAINFLKKTFALGPKTGLALKGLIKGPDVIFGDSFCRTVWGVCWSWICVDYFRSLFFPLAAKLIGPQTGCQFLKKH